ncbi:heat shock 70 kDa protein 12A-like [Saccostrea cucullata]|uniref:heat shock 70 kDa protein 12A-like n=1 Tax=Saccostrea cuccullata TaxID=36930 RepID=UPI002ED52A76
MATSLNPQDFLVVSAIDFGTTYSGYAFSLRDSPNDLYSPQTWYAGGSTLASLKTPTCILLKENQSFDSFGYEAQNRYATLAEDGNHQDYYFFQQFKMTLHKNRSLSRGTILEDITGKALPAMLIFSLSINYFKDHILQSLRDRIPTICLEDIRFVLTVPAIWDDNAKQFMREAAINAGIDGRRLILALEPEAASFYCKQLPVEKLPGGEGFTEAPDGTKYLIADIGGGTADFCVHQKVYKEKIKEIHRASGGAFGGIYVDTEYEKFILKAFGSQSLQQLKIKDMFDFLEIMRSFEVKKRDANLQQVGNIVIRIPVNLVEVSKSQITDLGKHIEKQFGHDEVSVSGDKLKMKRDLFNAFFSKSINGIINHISDILRKFPDIRMILLVGGYAESPILQTRMKNSFKEQILIIPQQCGMAVVKGAVLYGHKPELISSRILKYTYGVNHNLTFDPKQHPEERKYINEDGKEKCHGTVKKLISRGTSVKTTGEVKTVTAAPYERSSKSLTTKVYFSKEEDPTFTDQCTLLGKVELKLPPYAGKRRVVQESFTFGQTEISVTTTFLETGDKVEASFDLLE